MNRIFDFKMIFPTRKFRKLILSPSMGQPDPLETQHKSKASKYKSKVLKYLDQKIRNTINLPIKSLQTVMFLVYLIFLPYCFSGFISIIQIKEFMSSGFFSLRKTDNFGGRLVLNQEQKSHQLKLQAIYAKSPNAPITSPKSNHRFKTKKQLHETREHQNNIKYLFQYLMKPKTMQDRYKDPNDFYAYPTLFFREAKTQTAKPKTNKKLRRHKSVNLIDHQDPQKLSAKKYDIEIQTIKQYLPYIQQFTREEIEEYADAITRIIFNHNMNTRQRLSFLKKCLKKTVPKSYPADFPLIIDEIFMEIQQSLGFT